VVRSCALLVHASVAVASIVSQRGVNHALALDATKPSSTLTSAQLQFSTSLNPFARERNYQDISNSAPGTIVSRGKNWRVIFALLRRLVRKTRQTQKMPAAVFLKFSRPWLC